jgi:hypothetical protein
MEEMAQIEEQMAEQMERMAEKNIRELAAANAAYVQQAEQTANMYAVAMEVALDVQ